MMRFLFTGNHKLMTSIASKALTKCFRKGLRCKTTKVQINDISFMDEGEDRVIVHISGDFNMNRTELMTLIDCKLGDGN